LDLGKDMTFTNLTLSFLATNSEVDTIISAIVDYRKNDNTHQYKTLNDFTDSNNVRFSANSANNGVFKNTVTNITFRYVYISYTSASRSNFTSDSLSNWQLENSNSATTYEPYTAPTQYTAQLGRTIHGGVPDVVKGEGQETYGKKVFDGTEGTGGTPSWTMISVSQGTMFRITVSDKVTTSATNTLCSYYTPVAQAQRADGTVSGAGTNVDIIDNRFSSVDAFKAWLAENPVTLVYELATPTDFAFEPVEISSRLGNNTMWSDEGDTTVVYRRDIDLALQAVSSSRGLMMASQPVAQLTGEQADLDQVNELNEETENTEEQEGEQDAR
jgi:hypothetical protein